MNTHSPTRLPSERADHTRARILDAAVQQFSAKGLAGARTEQIAEAAGVNKALLYYYFKSKESLYAAALELIFENVHTASLAVMKADISVGERLLQIALGNFDRSYSLPVLQSLMQQEMVRLHRGEENRMAQMAEKYFKPWWTSVEKMIDQGIASGEFIDVDRSQMRYAIFGPNIFYFLSAPLTRLIFGIEPLDRDELEHRRKAAILYLGKAIFADREHGAKLADQVLAATPMPWNEQAANRVAMIKKLKTSATDRNGSVTAPIENELKSTK
jgi:TetR/AcrR family transcriptional regulator